MKSYNEFDHEQAARNGWKLYNEEHAIWSWHETLLEASSRVAMEQRLYGRSFQIAVVTDTERQAYGSRLYEDGESVGPFTCPDCGGDCETLLVALKTSLAGGAR